MTRAFLAAGVAALAIAVPATAKPDQDRGGGNRGQAAAQHGGSGGQRATVQRGGGGFAAQRPQRMERQQVRMQQREFQRPQRSEERFAQRPERQQRIERVNRVERPQRIERVERQQVRSVERQERVNRIERQQVRVADRQQRIDRSNRVERQQARLAERQQQRIERQVRGNDRMNGIQNRITERQANRIVLNDDLRLRNSNAQAVGFGVGGCPPGLATKGCVPPGQALQANRIANADAFRLSRLAALAADSDARFIAPAQVVSYVGSPLSALSDVVALNALPRSVSYLYPDTDDYYYRYGGGYFYRVDRDNDLIDYILPALAGGFLPGQYLPTTYMNSYVPDYYGFSSFYPSSYAANYGYGYGYENLCNRYANGVIYQVDCVTGVIRDVVPVYAGGYGVGQYLPSSYGYYNVPYQYRDLYYNTDDYNYWYAPGAIYQVDSSTSLISAVAALLTPGFSVGQALPAGYGAYNVPFAYRDTYYDTPNAWYRYNNGYIYQVDPATQLVTAIVASVLT